MPTETHLYPPLHHHASHPTSALEAAKPLSAYLEKSLTRPYLHPDAWLSLEGVRHGPKSGPQGSWAMHHLRRIEAGMRGEVLEVESMEELVERFGEEVVSTETGVRGYAKREVDEAFVGAVEQDVGVGDWEERPKKVEKAKHEKPEHEMTKAEKKKARRAAEKAETQRAREMGEAVPSFKKRKRDAERSEVSVSLDERSEADEPSSRAAKSEPNDDDEDTTTKADINDPTQYTSARTHALSQKPLQEEVGDRDPAGVDREDAIKVPVVVEHDAQGEVKVPSKKRKASAEDEEARRAAKKAKKAERQAQKVKKEEVKDEGEGDGDAEMADIPEAAPPTSAAPTPATPAAMGEGGEKMNRKQRRKSSQAAATTTEPAMSDSKKAKKEPRSDLPPAPKNNGPTPPGKNTQKNREAKKAKREKAKAKAREEEGREGVALHDS